MIQSKEQAFADALREMESGIRHDGLWGMSFAEAMGDEQKAKAIYLSKRADELVRANPAKLSGDEAVVPRTQGLLSKERGSVDHEKFCIDLWSSVDKGEIPCIDATLFGYDINARNFELFDSQLSEQEVFLMEREAVWFVFNALKSNVYFRFYNPTKRPVNEVLLEYRAPKHSNYFFCNLGLAIPSKEFGIRKIKLPFNYFLRHGFRKEANIDVRGAK